MPHQAGLCQCPFHFWTNSWGAFFYSPFPGVSMFLLPVAETSGLGPIYLSIYVQPGKPLALAIFPRPLWLAPNHPPQTQNIPDGRNHFPPPLPPHGYLLEIGRGTKYAHRQVKTAAKKKSHTKLNFSVQNSAMVYFQTFHPQQKNCH